MIKTQLEPTHDIAPLVEIGSTEIAASDLTLTRLDYLPDDARPRTRNVVVFICTETGADYRLEADAIYDSANSVLARVDTIRFLVLPSGDKMCVSRGIWRIEHCG